MRAPSLWHMKSSETGVRAVGGEMYRCGWTDRSGLGIGRFLLREEDLRGFIGLLELGCVGMGGSRVGEAADQQRVQSFIACGNASAIR